jgi:hypothetical protein
MRVGFVTFAVMTFTMGLGSAGPADASANLPSPLDCAIINGACQPLFGAGSLVFGGRAGTLTVSYQQPGFKIADGVQLALNLIGVTGGTYTQVDVFVTGTGIAGQLQVPVGSYQVDGCTGCFNFAITGSAIDPNLPPGTAYTFTLTHLGLNGASSVVKGGPLNLGAAIHLAGGAGGPVFAGATGPAFPPAASLGLSALQFKTGDTLHVDLTVSNPGPALVADIFFGLALPPASGPALGCPAADAAAFLVNKLTAAVLTCLSAPPQSFSPLVQSLTLPANLAPTTIANFFNLVWAAVAPAGVYTLFIVVTPAGAFADGAVGLNDVAALTTATLEFTP